MSRCTAALLIASTTLLAGCDRAPSPAGAAPSATTATSSGREAAPPAKPTSQPGGGVPSFRAAIVPVLARDCAASEGCHGNAPTESVDLDLRADAAYRALVDAPTPVRAGAVRVKPGDPGRSFLVDKLTGKLADKEGKAMPLDPDTGAPLPASAERRAFVETVLVPWIRAGAPND